MQRAINRDINNNNSSSLWGSFYDHLGFCLWRLTYLALIIYRVIVVSDHEYVPSPIGLFEAFALLLSFGIALLCLAQHSDYTFPERNPHEKPLGSNNFHLVDNTDSVPPFYKETILGRVLYPLYSRFGNDDDIDSKVWTLRIWEPSDALLRILSWVSPMQILLYKWMTPERAYLNVAAIITLAYVQRKIIQLYEQMARDKKVINAQVQLEYDVKFVGPRAFRPSLESATQVDEEDLKYLHERKSRELYSSPEFTYLTPISADGMPEFAATRKTTTRSAAASGSSSAAKSSTPKRKGRSRKVNNHDLTRTNLDFDCPVDKPSPHKDYINIFQKKNITVKFK